ncbi:ABC transporter permease [Acrocarpospora catenulata]|uniref:ABC transporter permease n=1 Tax=Acrocarpospora catenulata TaxID=2836182 RepID=UPI001BDA86F6|nr:ABC transporter permease [Acrocarpospora catenulata]
MTDRSLLRAIGWYRTPIIAIGLLASLLFFVPFLVVVATSWTSGSFILFPPTGFSLQWYETVLTDRQWLNSFWLSVVVAVISTVAAVLLGTLGALGLTRIRSRALQRWVRTLFIAPIALPPIAYAVGLWSVDRRLPFLDDTLVSLVVGETLLAVPYVFALVSSGLAGTDPSLRPAASTLGASWPMILWRIELPPLLPSILGGALFAFTVVFDEVVLSVLLLPPGTQTLPLKMFTASQEAFSPELTAASTMVSLLAILVLGGAQLASNRRNRAARLRRKASA